MLADKTDLFKNLCNFYNARGENPYEKAFPLTFNIAEASDQDQQFIKFLEAFEQQELEGEGKIWILKPGEDTNRGNGIVVSSSLPEIIETINSLKGESGNS